MLTATGIITEIRKEQEHKVPALWDLPRGATIKTLGEEWIVSLVNLEEDPEELQLRFGDDYLYHFPVDTVEEGLQMYESVKAALANEAPVISAIRTEGVREDRPLHLQIHTKKIYAIDFNYSGNY